MRLGTELSTDEKCHDRPLATWDQKLFSSQMSSPLHWKEDLTIAAARNPETRALLGPESGQGKSKDKLPTGKEQRSKLWGKVVSLNPCAA